MTAQGITGNDPGLSNLLATGEEAFSREIINSTSVSPASGQLRLASFTARKTETITAVRGRCGSVAAGATPTLSRVGIYAVAADGSGTLLAAIASDTSMWAVANTNYQRNLTAPWNKVAGLRYGIGVIVVSGFTMPQFVGNSISSAEESTLNVPWLAASFGGLSDLPGTFAVPAAGQVSGGRPYLVMIP